MIKEKLEKFREKLKKKEGENSKKTIENLVVFIIVLIITIVAINYIWSDNGEKKNTNNTENKKLAKEETSESSEDATTSNSDNIEKRLEVILSNIKGVGKTKVLLTYSQTSQVIPMYDEDLSQSTTEEKDSGGGTRTVNETTSKKEVKYEENNGVKTPITQSVLNPKIEGAIVTAQGANDANVKTDIIQAVEAVTGLATYKIQVFEMKEEN